MNIVLVCIILCMLMSYVIYIDMYTCCIYGKNSIYVCIRYFIVTITVILITPHEVRIMTLMFI